MRTFDALDSGQRRNGAPGYDDIISTSGECTSRQMNDEDHEHMIALLNKRRRRYDGRRFYDNPNEQSEGDNPHGTV